MSNKLVFNDHPEFEIATNRFINVPIILQYDDTPLIQIIKEVNAGFTTEISIYSSDGAYLAKAKGTQLYVAAEGERAGVKLRHENLVTACELSGRTIFELRRERAAALKGVAELYTSDGSFIKANDVGLGGYVMDQKSHRQLEIGGVVMERCTFKNCRIGIHVNSSAGIGIGAA